MKYLQKYFNETPGPLICTIIVLHAACGSLGLYVLGGGSTVRCCSRLLVFLFFLAAVVRRGCVLGAAAFELIHDGRLLLLQ